MEASPKTVYEVEMITTIKKISNEWFDKAVEYRRYFHENPSINLLYYKVIGKTSVNHQITR